MAKSKKNKKQSKNKINVKKNIETKEHETIELKQPEDINEEKEIVEGPDIDLNIEIVENKKSHAKNKFLIIGIILTLLIIIIGSLYLTLPKLNLNGKSTVKISYNDKYNELGAKAKQFGKDISKDIKITGKVNTKKVGNYKITYSIKKGFITLKKIRLVKVVDEKKPVITLEEDNELVICPNEEYKEVGFKAEDEYDGDLTNKVEVKEEKDLITYTVKDSSNNTFSITRKLIREDKTNPEIKLNGNSTMYITLGTKYSEP